MGCEQLPVDDDSYQKIYLLKRNNPIEESNKNKSDAIKSDSAQKWRDRLRQIFPTTATG